MSALKGTLVSSVLKHPKAFEMWEKRTRFFSKDEIVRELGHGCGGTVYLCRDGKCAKVISHAESEEDLGEFAQEFDVLCKIWFSASQKQRECLLEPFYLEMHEGYLIIGMEHFDGMSIEEYIKKGNCLDEPNLARELCTTMEHLNSLGIYHADFGLHNVMVSHDLSKLRVIDYGFVYYMNRPRLFESLYEFTNPEELENGGNMIKSPEDMKKVQMWNTGILLLSMRFGIKKHDFGEENEELCGKHIIDYVSSFKLTESFFDRAIKNTLKENPLERKFL
ncbi:serine/threonine protein kinase [Brazilian marseillevirus]|uniref:serine/threonine protein kinase n=1 Tax=Brazilian marseillevirus TaxID=1813599 RepID=UPI000786097B|nr:serine/threonine protein kinase [Brazilian marseillevirus]AMQ10738.1 serine/threonine protein kinase [Brazilian marseillevirus]